MLLLGENGIVGFEAVFFKQSFIAESLNILKCIQLADVMVVNWQGNLPSNGFSRQRRAYSLCVAMLPEFEVFRCLIMEVVVGGRRGLKIK